MYWDSINVKEVVDLHRLLKHENRSYIPRLDTLKDKIAFDRIPSLGVTHSLEEAALERASDILKLPHKEIMILFSGGVDSTLAAVAIVKLNELNRNKKIIIGYTDSTIKYTDKNLFKWLTDRGCEYLKVDHDSLREYTRNGGFFVTGTHGDNLVLSDAVGWGNITVDDVWDITPEELMSSISKRENGDKLLKNYGYLFDEMPLEMNAPNMLWWVGFCFYWHRDSLYMTTYTDLGQPTVTHEHFFCSTPFQRWMMQDASIRCGRTSNDHKYLVIRAVNNIADSEFKIEQKTDGWDEVLDNKSSIEKIISIDLDWNIKTKFI